MDSGPTAALQTIELGRLTDVPPEEAPQGGASEFLTWTFDKNKFQCAVLTRKQHTLHRNDSLRIIGTVGEAQQRRALLEKAARSGFELLISVRAQVDELTEVFARLGYHEVGRGMVGDGGEYDPLGVAWNRDALEEAVTMAARVSNHHLCLFAHDEDPVYLLCRRDRLRQGSDRFE